MNGRRFKSIIRAYYKKHKRHMPWRATIDPYRILVSEVMLQQTQVSRVMKFYPDFIKKFPTFLVLARSRPSAVLKAWQGLGYNRRALNLQKLSRIVLEKFNGRLPQERNELEKLPGIGRGTSGALSAFAWNKPEVFIETNIRRVLIHFFFPKRLKVTDDMLERYIKSTLDRKYPREWYWALMDYGAMLGKTAGSKKNPNRRSAHYIKQSRFQGSDRELRGKLLSILLQKHRIPLHEVVKKTGVERDRVIKVIKDLAREGFLRNKRSFSVVSLI